MEETSKWLREASSSPASMIDEDSVLAPTAVLLVLLRVHPEFASLGHVVQNIDACVGSTRKWTLETASKAGYARLLDRLLVNEWSGLGDHFREARFVYNVAVAARAGKTDALRWWRRKYLPNHQDTSVLIICIAVLKGHLHVLKWLLEVDGNMEAISRMQVPLVCSSPEIVRWINGRCHVRMRVYLDEAALEGDLEFMKWVKAQANLTANYIGAFEAAAKTGHLDIMQYLAQEVRFTDARAAFIHAVDNGQLNVVEWLLRENSDLQTDSDIYWKMEKGMDFTTIKWFIEEFKWPPYMKGRWIYMAIKRAALFGDLEVVKYLFELQPDDNLHLVYFGVRSGKTEIVEWLHGRGVSGGKELLMTAVEEANVDMVKWIDDNCGPQAGRSNAMTLAVHNGFDMVRWIHGNRSDEVTPQAMDHAAALGRLDIVKFLHHNRCEGCTSRAMNGAAQRGHLEVVKFLHANRSEGDAVTAMIFALSKGHLDIAQWLYETSSDQCKMEKAVDEYFHCKGRQDISASLAKHSNPNYYDAFFVKQDVECKHFALTEWILRLRTKSLDFQDSEGIVGHNLLSPTFSPRRDTSEIYDSSDEDSEGEDFLSFEPYTDAED